jgi:hypothetical protein
VDVGGRSNLLTAAGPGALPHIKLFDGESLGLLESFYALDTAPVSNIFVG